MPTLERYICICGAENESKTFLAWDHLTGRVLEMTGFSCPTDGCGGNLAQRHEKRLQALQRLSREDRLLLGLLYEADWQAAEEVQL